MERETITFTTPAGNIFVVNTYLTGREKRALTNVYFTAGLNIDVETKKVDGFSAESVDVGQDLAFKTVVVSINGHKDNEIIDGKTFSVVDFILDQKLSEYDFIVAEINKVTTDKQFEEKKTI